MLSLSMLSSSSSSLSPQLHSVGTAASVSRITARSHPQPHFSLLATGLCRFRLESVEQEVPYLVGVVTQLDYVPSHGWFMHPRTLLTQRFEH